MGNDSATKCIHVESITCSNNFFLNNCQVFLCLFKKNFRNKKRKNEKQIKNTMD